MRAALLAEGAWGRAAGAALAPAQAAAYFNQQAAALMGVELGLPWAYNKPALRCSAHGRHPSASSTTCSGAGQVAAGTALHALPAINGEERSTLYPNFNFTWGGPVP